MIISIKKLVTISALAALMAIVGLAGNLLVSVTGIPGIGSIVNCFFGPLVYTFCLLIINEFGAGFLMGVLYGIIVFPLPAMGTPGFLPKIIIAALVGFSADVVYSVAKKNKKVAATLTGIPINVVGILAMAAIFNLFGVPGAEKFMTMFLSPLIAVLIVAGMTGGFCSFLIYHKLKNTAVVKRIQVN
jgi:hypothetical protein